MYNAFADKDENPEIPGSEWDYTFIEQTAKTTVSISIYNESPERMEKVMDCFKEGMSMTMTLLTTLSGK